MKRTLKKPRSVFLLFGIGVILLVAAQFSPSFLEHLASWPVQLAGIGLLIGILSRFGHPISYVLIVLGSFFSIYIDLPVIASGFLLPVLYIVTGFLKMLVTNTRQGYSKFGWSSPKNEQNKV